MNYIRRVIDIGGLKILLEALIEHIVTASFDNDFPQVPVVQIPSTTNTVSEGTLLSKAFV